MTCVALPFASVTNSSPIAVIPDTNCVADLAIDAAPAYHSFIRVVERDAGDAQAAVALVLAQKTIGSAIVDNLNASIHVRALLTDLFLIDEALKQHTR